MSQKAASSRSEEKPLLGHATRAAVDRFRLEEGAAMGLGAVRFTRGPHDKGLSGSVGHRRT